jgi:hypothetical protein
MAGLHAHRRITKGKEEKNLKKKNYKNLKKKKMAIFRARIDTVLCVKISYKLIKA